ncbi:NSP1 protein [Rotavirus A]|uniref:NSP1 protein n=1 Tax=Rotavirus A TaxID=28875 RepID=A0A0P0UPA8_9REOV|nr:NSP1 protein [Rotavirus A]
MASSQLRFEYSIIKFSKSIFNSKLKPNSYTKLMQWTQQNDKLNKNLWRTFNKVLIDDLPKGNCWVCGLFSNVYSCEFCNVNHICESCKSSRTDVCPFANTHSNRYCHDLISLGPNLTDESLYDSLKPVLDAYFEALSKPHEAAIWNELLKKRHAGMRIHTKSSVAVDFNDCLLPTNVLAFRIATERGLSNYILFGHYEPARNREKLISYTNLNLRCYKKTFDYINMLNIQLALKRDVSAKPMLVIDVSPNREVPYLNEQQYIVKLSDSEIMNYGIIHAKSPSSWTIARPILSILSPRNLMAEIFTAWLLNDEVEVSKVERMHYNSILRLSMELNWPNRVNKFINFTYFSYYQNMLKKALVDLPLLKRISRASVHMAEHSGLLVTNCLLCEDGNKAVTEVNMNSERALMRLCCYHDQSDADISNLFTVSHRLPHSELFWRTNFDLRAQMLHFASIAAEVLNYGGLLECFSDMPDFDQDIPDRCQLRRSPNESLLAMQKLWAISSKLWLNAVNKFKLTPENYRVADADEDGVILTEQSDEGIMLLDMSSKFNWLASKLSTV